MSVLSKIDYLVEHPQAALEEISEKRNTALGFTGYAVSAFSWAFLFGITDGAGIFGFIGQTILLFLIFALSGLFFASGAQIFLDFFTKKGSLLGLFAIIGICGFADILFVALSLIANFSPALNVLNSLFVLIVLLVKVFFLIYMISKAYHTSKLVSAAAMVMSLFPLALMGFTAMFLMIFAFVALIKMLF